MKKGLIITLILGIILLAAGGGIIAYAVVNREPTPIITNTYELTDEFTNISIDIGAEALEFVPTTDGTKKVVCEETEKVYNTVKVEEGTLKIVQTDNSAWYENWFNFDVRNMKVTVYMPQGEYDTLNISGSTGSILVPNEFSFNVGTIKLSTGALTLASNVKGDLDIEASTGSVSVKNITPKSLRVWMSTGALSLDNVNVTQACTLRVSTGRISAKNVTANTLTANSSTGSITLDNVVIVDSIAIKASTGDVTLEDCDAQTITIETSTGDVSGTLLTTKIFDAHSDTGHVNVPLSGVGGICKISTETGSITIRIKA